MLKLEDEIMEIEMFIPRCGSAIASEIIKKIALKELVTVLDTKYLMVDTTQNPTLQSLLVHVKRTSQQSTMTGRCQILDCARTRLFKKSN